MWNLSWWLFVLRMMTADLDTDVHELRPEQFEAFYSAFRTEVFKPLAATLGDRDLAREAVDEAMVRAYTRWSRVRKMDNPEGWVYRVAYRWAIDKIRRRKVESRLIPRLTPESSANDPMVEPKLSPAMAALPVEQRAVVILACVFEWPQAEIAEVLGIRVGTVKSRLHRALQRLREELDS